MGWMRGAEVKLGWASNIPISFSPMLIVPYDPVVTVGLGVLTGEGVGVGTLEKLGVGLGIGIGVYVGVGIGIGVYVGLGV